MNKFVYFRTYPHSCNILQRLWLLLSWVPLQPSGVISLLAVLNSLIICVLHKKRTIPQWHTTACSAWSGRALMCIGCCVVSIGFFRLRFSISMWMSVFLLWLYRLLCCALLYSVAPSLLQFLQFLNRVFFFLWDEQELQSAPLISTHGQRQKVIILLHVFVPVCVFGCSASNLLNKSMDFD